MKLKNDVLYQNILEEIKNNNKITEKYLADKYSFSERTIRRYIKNLKDAKKIKLVKIGKIRYWEII